MTVGDHEQKNLLFSAFETDFFLQYFTVQQKTSKGPVATLLPHAVSLEAQWPKYCHSTTLQLFRLNEFLVIRIARVC